MSKQKKVTNNTRWFNGSYCLWEQQFPKRYEVFKEEYNRGINRFFRNFIVVCCNKGYSQGLFLAKLKLNHGISLSRDRLKELAGIGRYAGRPYRGYLTYEWLYAISVFWEQDFVVMISEEFTTEEGVMDRVSNYWAGMGKGRRAGQPDLTRNSFPDALNYVVKRK